MPMDEVESTRDGAMTSFLPDLVLPLNLDPRTILGTQGLPEPHFFFLIIKNNTIFISLSKILSILGHGVQKIK